MCIRDRDGHAGCDKQFTTIENNALDIIEFVNSKLGGSVSVSYTHLELWRQMDWGIQFQLRVLQQSIGERIFLYSEEFLLKSRPVR